MVGTSQPLPTRTKGRAGLYAWWHSHTEVARQQQVFVVLGFLLWILPIIGITCYAFQSPTGGLTVWTVSFMAMSAAYLCGNLVGFLFAIPHSSGISEAMAGSGVLKDHRLLRPSTNLEVVSDWLTKIIVGVTLIELNKAPRAARTLFRAVGAEMGGQTSGVLFSGSLIIYSVAAGLMSAWVGTRLFLSRWIVAADSAVEEIPMGFEGHGSQEPARGPTVGHEYVGRRYNCSF